MEFLASFDIIKDCRAHLRRQRISFIIFFIENQVLLSTQLTIINRDNLRSIGEVEGKIEHLRYEVEKERQELNTLTTQQDTLTGLANQAEEYFALLEKQQPTPAEELRIKMYRTVLENHNIRSRFDYDYLKNVISETVQKKRTAQRKIRAVQTAL